jgi:hypothetical protein
MREPEYEYQELFIDTSTWTRKFQFKNTKLAPTPDSNPSNSQSMSNNGIAIYFLVGILLLLIFTSLIYYFIFRKRKNRELTNSGLIDAKINNLEPIVEWIRSDSNMDQLNNEAVFTLDDKATSRAYAEADRKADLHQLSSLNLAYKNNSTNNQITTNNSIKGLSGILTKSTLVNKANFDDITMISAKYPKN